MRKQTVYGIQPLVAWNAVHAGVTVNAGGTFDLAGLSETIMGLSGAGTVDDVAAGGTSTLTIPIISFGRTPATGK